MFAKLLKWEWRAASRLLAPLFGAAMLLTAASCAALALTGIVPGTLARGTAGNVGGFLVGLLMALTALGLFALIIVTVVQGVLRFYRNLLGDEGYLMFTLPATPAQLIGAKLLTAGVWTLLAGLFALLAAALMAVCAGASSLRAGEMARLLAQSGVSGGQMAATCVLMVLLMIAGCAGSYLLLYLAMAIGAQWPANRLAASIGAWAAMSFCLQVLGLVLAAGVGAAGVSGGWLGDFVRAAGSGAALQLFPLLNVFFGVLLVLAAALCTGMFFLVRWLLGRRLNLA